MRRLVVLAPVLLAWFLTADVTCDAADSTRPPNVLFIAVDDLNDWVGCLGGNPDCRTPHIDRLAARGTLFARSYCAAPACNPSRAALMSGLRPSSTGVYYNSQPWRPAMPDVVTLPQHFMAHGYHAVGCGKIYHGRYPDPPSWEHYVSRGPDPQPIPAVLNDPRSKSGGIVWGVLDVDDSQMDDHRIVDWALDYLSQDHDKPFFLACGLFRPHMPWQVPLKYYAMYPHETLTLPKVLDSDLDDVPPIGLQMARPERDHKTMLETGNWRYAVQAYLASISFADAQVGRLLDALDASSYADNTIIVLWGDHGWHLGEKHHWRKFALWEEATRMPLIVVAPGVTKAGSVCQRTVDLMHLYPTLTELCGLPPRKQAVDGRSIVPLLKDPESAWDVPAVTTHGRNNHAVRSERYRFIRYADGREELYDHQQDPLEWTNVAERSDMADVKAKLAVWLPAVNVEEALKASEIRNRGREARSGTK